MCSFINILLFHHYPSFKSNGTATNVYSTVDRCRSTDSRDRGYLNTNPCTWSSQWWTAGRYCQSWYRQANQISWPMCAVVRQSDPDCCDLTHASPRRPPPWRGEAPWTGVVVGSPRGTPLPPPVPCRPLPHLKPERSPPPGPQSAMQNCLLSISVKQAGTRLKGSLSDDPPPPPRPNNRLLSQNHISLISEHL